MGAATRKTWLERQKDEVQFDVLNWDDSGELTIEQMCARLKKDYGLAVAHSTLHHSLQAFHKDGGVRLVEMMSRFLKKHPEAEAHTLTKASVLAHAASEEFRKAQLKPLDVLISAQVDKRLQIQARLADAKERANEIRAREVAAKEEQLRIAREKIAAATGGIEARELYLQAAQDVLKKLHTYKELKTALHRRKEEIVGELANSAESFARQIEHEA